MVFLLRFLKFLPSANKIYLVFSKVLFYFLIFEVLFYFIFIFAAWAVTADSGGKNKNIFEVLNTVLTSDDTTSSQQEIEGVVASDPMDVIQQGLAAAD